MVKYKISETFSELFPARPQVLEAIREHMEEFGYDPAYPIILGSGDWTEEPVLIDGHTRVKIADSLGIEPPFVTKDFNSEDDALEYAIHNQRDRRNLSEEEFFRCLKMLDSRKQRGGANNPTGSNQYVERSKAPDGANDHDTPVMSLEIKPTVVTAQEKNEVEQVLDNGKSAEKMAKLLGVSTRKVERARAVIKDAPEDIKDAVLSGEKTVNKAYEEVREIKKQEEQIKEAISPKSKSIFNATNDNIEWANWSWNPVTGCHHGCKYCYARDITARFGDPSLPVSKRFDYTVHRNRFDAPINTKIPQSRETEPGIHNVFVCSMADLFGEWVDVDVILEVIDICRKTPQWNYLFLTKNPERLTSFDFPDNSWVGTTVDVKSRVDVALRVMPQVNAPVKFISVEPFLEDLAFPHLDGIDWLIIGGCSESSGGPEVQPEWYWVEDLMNVGRESGCKIYWKPNLRVRPKEYPV